jgi:hypothetical protein
MKFIKKFNNYDSIEESLISESVLYFSPPLRDKLKLMDSDISNKLLELEGTDVNSDVTFVNLVDGDDGIVSFMPMRQALTKIKNAYPDASNADLQAMPDVVVNDALYANDFRYNNSKVYNSSARNTIKIGKFIKKVLGNLPDIEVERFVNGFKTSSITDVLKVELVSGKDITYWYDSDNYEEKTGTLGSSCMAGKQFFQLYEENPEVCQLAIIQRDGKLIARALVWKVESDNPDIKYYMDRPYSTKDHYVNILTDWAKSKDMALWRRTFGCVEFRGEEIYPDMKVKVKKINYSNFPYLDTFRRYDYRKGYLYNDTSHRKRGYQLTSTQGSFSKNSRSRLQRFGDYFGLGESNLN